MENYFNTLSLREQIAQLGKCDFMNVSEFKNGIKALQEKKDNHLKTQVKTSLKLEYIQK
jgi:hypothetical protein